MPPATLNGVAPVAAAQTGSNWKCMTVLVV